MREERRQLVTRLTESNRVEMRDIMRAKIESYVTAPDILKAEISEDVGLEYHTLTITIRVEPKP